MTSYPLPSYAAHIWTVGDKLIVAFPSPVGGRNHVVEFPATPKGLTLAIATLHEREKTHHPAWLATKAAPSKYQVERALAEDKKYKAWLANMTETKERQLREAEEATKFLEDLGLIPIAEKVK